MRVDVFINKRAGHSDRVLIEKSVRENLYRCDLHFHASDTIPAMDQAIERATAEGSQCLMICGGDGTLNAALQPLMRLRETVDKVPPVLLVPVGTANDLAHEIGISSRIDRATRAIFDGSIKVVDVIEIKANGRTSYMITNGGMGIPAHTARKANFVRKWIKTKASSEHTDRWLKPILKVAERAVSAVGSRIYEIILVNDMISWDESKWEAEIEIPGKTKFITHAPFILVNNQPSVGGKFVPAPFTSNSDGTFNVLLIQPTRLLPQAKNILDIRMGRVPDVGDCPSFECSTMKIRAKSGSRPLTFFGDGEILHKGVREVSIRCIHPGLPVYTTRHL